MHYSLRRDNASSLKIVTVSKIKISILVMVIKIFYARRRAVTILRCNVTRNDVF